MQRRFPIGAEVMKGGAHFRVWAPDHDEILLYIHSKELKLESEKNGYFSLFVKGAASGDFYLFKIDSEFLPDPASRYQPEGPGGPSQLVDPFQFKWREKKMKKTTPIFYEMHIGTFTPEGTWVSAKEKLPELADLGITHIEMMPVNDFQGTFGWGYDGVNLFAPTRLYGKPDDLKDFIQTAHDLNISVILDVVYNHFGPGEKITPFAKCFYHETKENEWGRAINFEEKGVREFYCTNALYWLEEYHFDGLRYDATQNIEDHSPKHILAEINEMIRKKDKDIFLIGENESQDTKMLTNYGLDTLWNDDFHHTANVRLTGRKEAYYSDYSGTNQELISSLKYGYLYQGQYYKWQKKNRGTSALKFSADRFVIFLQNHDQIANSTKSLRLDSLAHPSEVRVMTLLLLLSPNMPLLFQGQEWGASTPFFYFADHDPHISRLVWEGRRKFLSQFPSFLDKEIQDQFPDPSAKKSFMHSKLNWNEKKEPLHSAHALFCKEVIQIKKEDPIFSHPEQVDGAVINENIFLLRFMGKEDRLIFLNFGNDETLSSVPDPLYAPPQGQKWEVMFSTEYSRFGGSGQAPLTTLAEWCLKGKSALIFKSTKALP